MGRSLTPGRQALSDQLVAALKASAPMPLGTSQLCLVAGKVTHRTPCKCRCGHVHETSFTAPARSYDVTPLLVRLEKLGVVERIVIAHGPGNGSGQHWWRWIGEA